MSIPYALQYQDLRGPLTAVQLQSGALHFEKQIGAAKWPPGQAAVNCPGLLPLSWGITQRTEALTHMIAFSHATTHLFTLTHLAPCVSLRIALDKNASFTHSHSPTHALTHAHTRTHAHTDYHSLMTLNMFAILLRISAHHPHSFIRHNLFVQDAKWPPSRTIRVGYEF